MKNSIFARFAGAFFTFWYFEDDLVLSTTRNDLFCSCVEDVSIWWQMLIFVFLCPKRWFIFNPRIVRTNFSSILTLNNWKMIAETRSYIFRWRSRFRRRRVCLSSLMLHNLRLAPVKLNIFPALGTRFKISCLAYLPFRWLGVFLFLSLAGSYSRAVLPAPDTDNFPSTLYLNVFSRTSFRELHIFKSKSR